MDNLISNFKKRVFIVAEIGKNFIQTKQDQSVETYLTNAKILVDESRKAGADAVKFQTHNFEDEHLRVRIVSPHFSAVDRVNWIKRNTLATPVDKFWLPLKEYCDKKGILFFSTPMSRGAAQILEKIGVKLWKVGSADILDFVMLDFISRTNKPIILSSGMSTFGEVSKAINFLKKRNKKIILLHCVSKYPCSLSDLNLKTISFLKKRFRIPIGFSDHSLTLDSAAIAVALGVQVIEKHFSLSRDFWGADHKVSLTPNEFKLMVDKIRALENDPKRKKEILDNAAIKKLLGKSRKFVKEEEKILRPVFRKSLVAACDISKGSLIGADMIYAMRPQKYCKGLKSEEYEKVLGKKVVKALKKYEPINYSKVS